MMNFLAHTMLVSEEVLLAMSATWHVSKHEALLAVFRTLWESVVGLAVIVHLVADTSP